MTSPGSLTRYAAIKKASTHATLREEMDTGWSKALLEYAEKAEAQAAECRKAADRWEARGDTDFADMLRAAADADDERAKEYRART